MTNDEARAALSPGDVTALTMFGEARGDSHDGSSIEERLAIGCVIRNRVMKRHLGATTFQQACWAPKQFSCWNAADPNSEQLWTFARSLAAGIRILDPLLRETWWLAGGVINGDVRDMVLGATHYYSPRSMKPVGSVPAWAMGVTPVARFGSQLFFRGV